MCRRRPGRWGRLAAGLLVGVGLAGCAGSRPRAIALIVVDSLRADHLGTYGYERPTSPLIDGWAREAAVFERAFSTSSWTLPAFGSMYTGRLPTRHATGVRIRRAAELPGQERVADLVRHQDKLFLGLDPALPTLAELLRDAGYATGAVVNNAFLNARFGVARGFDAYDYAPEEHRRVRPADVTVDAALRWIDGLKGEPFFPLLHLLDPPMPYAAPEPFRGWFTKPYADGLPDPAEDVRALRREIREGGPGAEAALALHAAAYDEEIAFVDAQVGRFLANLQRRGLLEEALVVLTSDHGEELFDHGGFEHGHTMYDELLRVPLMFWGRQVKPGHRAAPVSLVDLMPTLLEAAGVDPPEELAGASLWPVLRAGAALPQRPLYAERTLYGEEQKAVIEWPRKAIVEYGTGRSALYDLAADPAEQVDLAAQHEDALYRMLAELQERMWRAEQGVGRNAVTLDEELLEQLRALGYLR